MIKYIRSGFTFLLTLSTLGAWAQSTATSSSPYSQFGLGDINTSILPQNRAMGGIATATNKINGYNSINIINPASYSNIGLTTIDVGVFGNLVKLQNASTTSQQNTNIRLSHFLIAAPVSKRSAISFGLTPYSDLGYNYRQRVKGFNTGNAIDTNTVNYIYSGDGGLSKAFIGYGFGLGSHISFGGNVSYIFGNLRKFRSTELPYMAGSLNSRTENTNSIGGVNFDYGTQITFSTGENSRVIFGYSGSASSQLNSKVDNIITQYTNDDTGTEYPALDTISKVEIANGKLKLPLLNHFGVSWQKDGKYLIGAEYSTGNWAGLVVPGNSQTLQNSQSYMLGGQITPNMNALNNYFALIDYRLGVRYDKTYININNTDIKQYTLSFGLGLPLPRNNTAFYKINFAAEVGRRGTFTNNLIRENIINLHLGFTLNDSWFAKYKFD
jgi:hypothetical protein